MDINRAHIAVADVLQWRYKSQFAGVKNVGLVKLQRWLQILLYAEPGNAPRIEIVSGFRTPKLNEMRRKKGHHVALHSEHSLGHAVDFRIVRSGETRGVDPRELERAIRASGWAGVASKQT